MVSDTGSALPADWPVAPATPAAAGPPPATAAASAHRLARTAGARPRNRAALGRPGHGGWSGGRGMAEMLLPPGRGQQPAPYAECVGQGVPPGSRVSPDYA